MLVKIVEKIADEIIQNKEYLTELDRVIGDGDHGVNLARGFEEIKAQISSYSSLAYSDIFQKMGMTLLTKVGGASGAIYGTAFMSAGMYCKGKTELEKEDIVAIFKAMIEGVKKRGKASLGEKTLLDTVLPVYDLLQHRLEQGEDILSNTEEIKTVAKQGMESTKDIIATKGRASYVGERSLGHIDPGAASSYMMIKVICEEIK
ncbi:dihydroxyacetone kinase, L subunit [Fusobacterium gonidiaformans 3-1-5R]|uniref:Dihydroxyacetone kinase, L subunit n=2 Tax=Fusobacterium TaxID=848 RepID=E5BF30_9FUSO|nr:MULTISPECIES: dihydroxyacetone kinase subunit DhaL [Fusobacterium]AVQ16959.1 dihydroxyacetone kinase subunit L [Fusobacterium gonidiaformans ATCC 25563]EFS20711.1 dihydroxyacetone kinase, L subunit [Fusobacterium gonidiaformans 3-1-5R]EFS28804.1 dihydroxyacetone kinase, L subunit [Fusobacterium gonidiaformans ATCC 25563]KXA16918.1 dihydroxyacetone kinase, L subunit [Fusobacterium equinum]